MATNKLRKIVRGQTWTLLVQMLDELGAPIALADYDVTVSIGKDGTKGISATITEDTYQFPGQPSATPCYKARMEGSVTKRLQVGSNTVGIWRTLASEIRPTDPDQKVTVQVVDTPGAP